jgi:hypothetical protein
MKAFLCIILLSILSPSPLHAQLVNDFRVNQIPSTLDQWRPSLDVDGQGNFVVVWNDRRRNKANTRTLFNIMCQRYNFNAEPLGKNFRINVNLDSADKPSIAVQKSGKFAVSWVEMNKGMYLNIYFRLFNADGIPVTDPILINDTITGELTDSPVMKVSHNGIYVITWKDRVTLSYPYKILYQLIDSLGNKLGSNKRSDDYGNSIKARPSVTVNGERGFVITWEDRRDPGQANHHIYMQMFDTDGNPIGINQRVSEFTDWLDPHRNPKISSDSSGNYIIAWLDGRDSYPYLRNYAQAYNKNGEKIGINFRMVDILEPMRNVIAKLEDGKYVLGTDYAINLSTRRSVIQRFDSSNTKIGGLYQLTYQAAGSGHDYSDIKVFGDRIISVWLDNRDGPANVYCNIRSFQNPDSVLSNVILISNETSESFELYQNYPNPFNPVTTIRYSVKTRSNISLTIFDILGREIKTFINDVQDAGNYSVEFDSSNLPSGIYLYKFIASDPLTGKIYLSDTKKAVILK